MFSWLKSFFTSCKETYESQPRTAVLTYESPLFGGEWEKREVCWFRVEKRTVNGVDIWGLFVCVEGKGPQHIYDYTSKDSALAFLRKADGKDQKRPATPTQREPQPVALEGEIFERLRG